MASSSTSAAPADSGSSKKKSGGSNLNQTFIALMSVCVLVTVGFNLLHSQLAHHEGKIQDPVLAFHQQHLDNVVDAKAIAVAENKIQKKKREGHDHELAGLSCEKYGGPLEEEAVEEMVYWKDIPSDALYKSPYSPLSDGAPKYMTFEPDGGGWNNIRMAMETVVALAHAMGRILVLPPEQRMYLLRKDHDKQKTHFSFQDFFHMDSLANEHDGLEIITMEEFLEREAMTGHLVNKTTGKVSFPPNNRTNWNGEDVKALKEWLREVTHTPLWKYGDCVAAFPKRTDDHHKDVEGLKGTLEEIVHEGLPNPRTWYHARPTPVDAPAKDRLREAMAQRKELCIYDEVMQEAPVVHFMCYHKMRIRLLTHFYTFLWFQDWKQQLWMNRFVRDHLRYVDELQCAAARVVQAVRERARQKDPSNINGEFDSFHIRRGDFQFKNTRIEAKEIFENSRDKLTEGATVYIATDERKKEFFQPLKDHYDVVFLDDFKDVIKDLNTNYYGMLDQLVATKGRVFFGCWFSTFTGYIIRLRGYHSTKLKLEGYEKGALPNTYYYAVLDKKMELQEYEGVRKAFFSREFPVSWRDIDKGIDMEDTNILTAA